MTDQGETVPPPSYPRIARILQSYPVTALVIAPYAILIIPLAIVNQNLRTGFIIQLLILAMAGAAVVETLSLLLRSYRKLPRVETSENCVYPKMFVIARLLVVLSVAADVTHAASGGGTIFTQVTVGVASSPLASLTAPLAGWKYISFALLILSFLTGHTSRRSVYRWVGVLLAAQLFLVSLTAMFQPFVSYITFVAAIGMIFGVIKARHVCVAIVVLILSWPAVFTVRNQIREDNGIRVSSEYSAADRLRFDLQVSRASLYDAPVDVGQPGLPEFFRYGLLPRFLDSERPPLSTGSKINQALGGDPRSSFTFLPLGTVYFLEGYAAIPLFYGVWAFAAVLLLWVGRPPGPIRICLFSLVVAGPLGWSSTYPDAVIGLMQNIVSATPVFCIVRLTRRATTSWHGMRGSHG